VVKRLLYEGKHANCVFGWPGEDFWILRVELFAGEPAEFETEGACNEQREVVQEQRQKGAPEKHVHPLPADGALAQHGAVVYVQGLQHPKLVEVRPAPTLPYTLINPVNTYQVKSTPVARSTLYKSKLP